MNENHWFELDLSEHWVGGSYWTNTMAKPTKAHITARGGMNSFYSVTPKTMKEICKLLKISYSPSYRGD